MAPVDKYIRKLLFEFDCVIIPDFGGLLTHRVGVRYDESAQLFKPTGKRLAFNEILKIDDGLLAYYLAAGEQISREQATEQTRKFVASLRADLETQQSADIDKIGRFSTNYEGKLIFEPDYTQNYDQEWYGFQEFSAECSECQPNWLRQDVNDIEVLVDQEESIILSPNKRNVRWGWAAAAVLICAVSAASYFYQPTDHNLLSSLNPITAVRDLYQPSAEVADSPQEKFESSNVKVVYFQEIKPEIIPALAEPEAVFEEDPTMIAASPAVAEMPEVIEIEKDYFLIAGSFSGKKNAHRLKAQLRRLGFDDASVLEEKSGKWIKVSAGSYENHAEALQDKDKVDKLSQAESWVFHRK